MNAARHLRVVTDESPPPPGVDELTERIKLALAIISQRTWPHSDARNVTHVRRALQGALISDLMKGSDGTHPVDQA